jgi:hypothetical protein
VLPVIRSRVAARNEGEIMATIRVQYQLNEQGRKASLLTGGNGKAAQFVDVAATVELLTVVNVDNDGNAAYNLSPEVCYPVVRNCYSAPLSAPEAAAEVLRIAAGKQAKAEQDALKDAEKKAAEEKAHAEQNARWLTLAQRFIAGDPEVKRTNSFTCVFNDIHSWNAEAPSLREQIDAETNRRGKIQADAEAAKHAAEEKASAERNAKINAARLAWLREHGTVDQVERFEADVLPEDELFEAIHAAVLPEKLGEVGEYQIHHSVDVRHKGDCGESPVVWSVEDGNGCTLTATQWAHLKAIRAAAAGIPDAVVDVRKHVANLDCGCTDPFWLAARVCVTLTDLDVEVQRQYALDD